MQNPLAFCYLLRNLDENQYPLPDSNLSTVKVAEYVLNLLKDAGVDCYCEAIDLCSHTIDIKIIVTAQIFHLKPLFPSSIR
jgi:hypothetical protein